ncbi:hypothetical protein CK501_00900 [Halovibrio salipaludis]|uniref:DUF3034 family protein n=1 Tax=Halovibrio salipaludis TaxID=2032626 RepID=A0A2A2F866_9GAMM|nr:DUF3034 family protein [Halovibrio salipaludis]PAU81741.1 hypothetical protein CK501_00900 [Halovibrio salipaludis]
MKTSRILALGLSLALTPLASADPPGSRLWGTGGVTSIEGSAGGGLSPWATLAGYASDEEWGGTVALSRANTQDYTLNVQGAALNWHNRIEVSFARQELTMDTLAFELDFNETDLTQDIFGIKARLAGDLIYSPYGQWSLGAQHKRHRVSEIPLSQAVGAENDSGTDVYLSGSKLFLAGPFGRNVVVNGTLRATRANQGGLLGFGGDRNDSHELMAEASAGVFLRRDWVVGGEYRQKPNNLGFAGEDDWWDLYVAWIPDRRLSVTAAWVNLGDIAGLESQDGAYLSIEGSF